MYECVARGLHIIMKCQVMNNMALRQRKKLYWLNHIWTVKLDQKHCIFNDVHVYLIMFLCKCTSKFWKCFGNQVKDISGKYCSNHGILFETSPWKLKCQKWWLNTINIHSLQEQSDENWWLIIKSCELHW